MRTKTDNRSGSHPVELSRSLAVRNSEPKSETSRPNENIDLVSRNPRVDLRTPQTVRRRRDRLGREVKPMSSNCSGDFRVSEESRTRSQ